MKTSLIASYLLEELDDFPSDDNFDLSARSALHPELWQSMAAKAGFKRVKLPYDPLNLKTMHFKLLVGKDSAGMVCHLVGQALENVNRLDSVTVSIGFSLEGTTPYYTSSWLPVTRPTEAMFSSFTLRILAALDEARKIVKRVGRTYAGRDALYHINNQFRPYIPAIMDPLRKHR